MCPISDCFLFAEVISMLQMYCGFQISAPWSCLLISRRGAGGFHSPSQSVRKITEWKFHDDRRHQSAAGVPWLCKSPQLPAASFISISSSQRRACLYCLRSQTGLPPPACAPCFVYLQRRQSYTFVGLPAHEHRTGTPVLSIHCNQQT